MSILNHNQNHFINFINLGVNILCNFSMNSLFSVSDAIFTKIASDYLASKQEQLVEGRYHNSQFEYSHPLHIPNNPVKISPHLGQQCDFTVPKIISPPIRQLNNFF